MAGKSHEKQTNGTISIQNYLNSKYDEKTLLSRAEAGGIQREDLEKSREKQTKSEVLFPTQDRWFVVLSLRGTESSSRNVRSKQFWSP